ncbi:VanZ family protein [Haladaptatus sp. CMAA 1911]|uniref:VanZ family protein n=1 Tax=unclassified Haladaptatus TaxID=2622732 RepID=UPI00375431F7
MRYQVRWLPAVVIAVAIFVMSVAPRAPGEALIGPFGLMGLDKYGHAFAYCCLAGTVTFALVPRDRWVTTIVLSIAVVSLYGGGVEIIQGVVGRDLSVFDWIADILGAIVGALLATGLDPWLTRFRLTA